MKPIVFVEDDFDAARTRAKNDGKLLFVDGWAPWCHTCLSMQREVLSQPDLGVMSEHYVFAAIDTDRDENAPFLGRFPMKAWPTFFVLDPVDLRIVASRGGSLSLVEMHRFLEMGVAARTAHGHDTELTKTLSEAHALFGSKDFDHAADAYERASSVAWSRRNEALLGAMRAFSSAKLDDRCRSFGLAHIADVDGSSAPGDFLYYLRECGHRAPAPQSKEILDVVLTRLRGLSEHPPIGSSVDDQADVLDILSEAEGDAGDESEKRRAQQRRLTLLEKGAAEASSPEEARVHDYARMGAYLALGRGEEAVSMLRARTRELPDSYEAWARLGSTLHTLHREPDAKEAITRAIALAYGPRKLRYLALSAEIEMALGDREAQIATLRAEIAGHHALRAGQADPDKLADAEKRLAAALEATAAKPAITPPNNARTKPSH